MKFWQIYRIVSGRKWIVLGIMAVTMIAICVSTAQNKPTYRASAQVMPSETAIHSPILPSPSSSGQSPLAHETMDNNELPNLMSLLKTRQVAVRTIRAAGLNETPEGLLNRIDVGTADNPGARTHNDAGHRYYRDNCYGCKP